MIKDVKAVGDGEAVSSSSVIAHEIIEQGVKQLGRPNKRGYDDGHQAGKKIEKALTGYTRGEDEGVISGGGNYKTGPNGISQTTYVKGKTTVTVTYQFVNGNLKRIDRTPTKN